MRAAQLIPLALLAACGKPDNAPGPGGVTVGEARALDDAAQMIESENPPRVGTATVAASATATPDRTGAASKP